jgi:hypothetical protein
MADREWPGRFCPLQTRLNELAAAFPDLRHPLTAIFDRLADLLPIVRNAVYCPAAGFSNSIKSVAPALCPEFTYDDLEEIANGTAASAAFLRMASGSATDWSFLPSIVDVCGLSLMAGSEPPRASPDGGLINQHFIFPLPRHG